MSQDQDYKFFDSVLSFTVTVRATQQGSMKGLFYVDSRFPVVVPVQSLVLQPLNLKSCLVMLLLLQK